MKFVFLLLHLSTVMANSPGSCNCINSQVVLLIPFFFKEILNFTQSAEAAAPFGNITFFCEAVGPLAEFRINGQPFSDFVAPSHKGFIFNSSRIDEGPTFFLSLTITAFQSNNDTTVTCYIYAATRVVQHRHFIIAGNHSIL